MAEAFLSDEVFKIATTAPVVSNRDNASKALRQRGRLLSQIRNAIVDDEKSLRSESDDASFSKHGSLFHRLYNNNINDIDVYVIFNGHGLYWGNHALIGPSKIENRNCKAFQFPLGARTVAEYIYQVVQRVLKSSNAEEKVTQTKRGAKIEGYGSPKRDYDIIPAFAYCIDGVYHHIIPNDNIWESNPTQDDMRMVIDLDKKYFRDQQSKILGYRDFVKLIKYWNKNYRWEESHGLTSFVIRFAVATALQDKRQQSRFNQKTLQSIFEILDYWVTYGWTDPYTKQRLSFKNKYSLPGFLTFELNRIFEENR